MKRILLTFIILFTFLQMTAQNPEIVDPAKKWSYMCYEFFPPYYSLYLSYYNKFEGDTIIDQKSYLKLWEADEDPPESWYFKGFAREDSAGKVFFRNSIGEEGLVYRFDILPGDTFTMLNPFYDFQITVEVMDMDTVNIQPAGGSRKRWKLQEYEAVWPLEEYWIEGIGSMEGMILSGEGMVPLTGCIFTALCYWINGSVVYSNPEFNSCFVTVSTPETSKESPEIIIQPNPLTNKSHITIKGFEKDNYQLEITDMFGKVIKQYSTQQEEEISIHRGTFRSGLYLVTLFDGNTIIGRKKLLVQ